MWWDRFVQILPVVTLALGYIGSQWDRRRQVRRDIIDRENWQLALDQRETLLEVQVVVNRIQRPLTKLAGLAGARQDDAVGRQALEDEVYYDTLQLQLLRVRIKNRDLRRTLGEMVSQTWEHHNMLGTWEPADLGGEEMDQALLAAARANGAAVAGVHMAIGKLLRGPIQDLLDEDKS